MRFLSQERKEKETGNVFRATGVILEMKKTISNVLEMISVNREYCCGEFRE